MSALRTAPDTGCIGRLVTYLGAALLVSGLLTLGTHGAARPGTTASPALSKYGLLYAGLVRASNGPCRGVYVVRSEQGWDACTHGPDPAPPGIDVRRRATLAELRERAWAVRGKTAASSLPCSGNAAYSVQAIYAHPAGTPDNLASYLPLFRQYAQDVEWVFHASASEMGGERAIRFVTDASCQLSIVSVAVSDKAAGSVQAMAGELEKKGFAAPDRKYLIWMDASKKYCGIGQYYNDPRPGQDNYNNGAAPMFARVDQPCWGLLGTLGESVEAHELTHTLGAVSFLAPHATAYGHCTDEWDAMCYVDGPGTATQVVCPPTHAALLDCNHDDYFSTDPTPGSWLANHWNTADSRFLISSGVNPPPPPPPPPPNPPPPPPTPPPPPAASATKTTISAESATLPADGKSRATITVQAKDAQGRNLEASGGVVELSTSAGKLSPVSDNHDGSYTASLTAGKSVDFALVRGTIAGTPIIRVAFVAFVPVPRTHKPNGNKAKCVVPRLARMTLFDAVIAVVQARCLPKMGEAYSRVPKGRVAGQRPKAGTKLPHLGHVTILISKGRRH